MPGDINHREYLGLLADAERLQARRRPHVPEFDDPLIVGGAKHWGAAYDNDCCEHGHVTLQQVGALAVVVFGVDGEHWEDLRVPT